MPLVRLLGHDGLVQNCAIRLDPKHPLVQLNGADALACRASHVRFHHDDPRSRRALVMRTIPPDGPGTAPLRARRLRAGSMASTSKFLTVTRALPIWPAMRVPFRTRPGVVPAPEEPSARQRSDWPCVLGPPPNPWRRTTPAKPRPLETAATSTVSPTANTDTSSFWPTVRSASESTGTSRRCFSLGNPFRWPAAGFESFAVSP